MRIFELTKSISQPLDQLELSYLEKKIYRISNINFFSPNFKKLYEYFRNNHQTFQLPRTPKTILLVFDLTISSFINSKKNIIYCFSLLV